MSLSDQDYNMLAIKLDKIIELLKPQDKQPEPPKEREPEKPKCETYLEKIRREERERTLSEILNIIKEKLNVSER